MKLKKENYEELAKGILAGAFAPSTEKDGSLLVLDYEYEEGELEIKHKACFNFNGIDTDDDFKASELQATLHMMEER